MKVVDLCACTGLFSHAFRLQGFDVVAAYELDGDKAAAYQANHPDARVHVQDVMQLTPEDILKHGDPSELVLIGGVPCQDFSKVNRKKQKDTTLRDHIMHLVNEVAPAAAAFENVTAAWEGVADVQHVQDVAVGGLTQRVRGFWRCPPVRRTHGLQGIASLDGRHLKPYRGWGEAIPGYTHILDFTQAGEIPSEGRIRIRAADRPSWTITGKCDFLMLKHGERRAMRWASNEEAARLHGFPDGWAFTPQTGKALQCIGDAVPLAMGRAIAEAIEHQVGGAHASSAERQCVVEKTGGDS